MATNPTLSAEAANAACDAIVDLLDGGALRIYDGTQPADPDTAITTQTLLAELRFGTPAFGSAVAGVATANAITEDSNANATGTASWFRALKTDGGSPETLTAELDGSIGAGGSPVADLDLSSTSITAGDTVQVSSLTITVPQSG